MLGESAFLVQATGGRNEVTESREQCGGILTAVEESTVRFALATALAFSQIGEKLRLFLRIALRYEADVEEADIGLAEGGNRGIRGAQNVAGCCVILAGLNAYVGAVGKEDDGPAIAAIMIAEFLERARVGQSVVGFQIGGALLVTESINLLVQGTSVSGNIGPTTVLASLGVIA